MKTVKLHTAVLAICTTIFLLYGCSTTTNPQKAKIVSADVRERAEKWLAIYAERSDWEALLDCYANDVKFEDQRIRLKLEGKLAFADFYDWPNELFRLADPEKPALVVHELVVDGTSAVARGRFLPFYWGEELFDVSDEFVFWLEFNQQGKISIQRDYIPYPKRFIPD
ncbi:MAG: nuclear transport factor 2 family protein [Pseudomonadota bacterium]